MSFKPTKYYKGEKVLNIQILANFLEEGQWFYLGNKPVHPSIIINMSLATLLAKIKFGNISFAEERNRITNK